MTEFHEGAATTAAKKQLEEDSKIRERMKTDYEARMKGKPTPTQQENDLAALGAHIATHEADGSDPDPHNTHIQAPAGYPTRQMTAQPAGQQTHRSAHHTPTARE